MKFLGWIVNAAFVLGIAACGGGGGNTAGIEGSGVTVAFTGNVVSSGQITGIGSIYVNGVEYSLDQASIGVNGGTGGEIGRAHV